MSKIARRQFLQLSAAAAAGAFVAPGRPAQASELPPLPVDDKNATSLRYTEDASTVDPSSRPRAEADQNCANCIYIQGNADGEWLKCSMFQDNSVAAKGWCMVWAPKA